MTRKGVDRRPAALPVDQRPGPGTGLAPAKLRMLAGVAGGIVTVDRVTKVLVERHLHLHQVVEVIGEYVRLTYIFNPGAAFGIHLGPYSREIFLFLTILALVGMLWLYWFTPLHDRVRLLAIALICGGAVGNMLDRIKSASGVVDFLDVGVGTLRWPVFNVADMAVTTGAVILGLSLWREESQVGRGT
jgi:signal peptidase II